MIPRQRASSSHTASVSGTASANAWVYSASQLTRTNSAQRKADGRSKAPPPEPEAQGDKRCERGIHPYFPPVEHQQRRGGSEERGVASDRLSTSTPRQRSDQRDQQRTDQRREGARQRFGSASVYQVTEEALPSAEH